MFVLNIKKHLNNAVFLFSLILVLNSCGESRKLQIIQGDTMGTTYTVKVVDSGDILEAKATQTEQEIEAALAKVNQMMSTFIEDSDLSLFNNFNDTIWYPVQPEMLLVFGEAQRISELSDGAFDITVEPLVSLWGFGNKGLSSTIPSDSAIEESMSRCGYENLEFSPDGLVIRKNIPGLHCDLSAIAKGYGVDMLAQVLDSLGFINYFIEIGGETRAKGVNFEKVSWRIGIASPKAQSEIQTIVSLSDMAMATSGDYHNYFEKDGIRYSHTINPATVRPITHQLASVTVLSETCMVADGLATALNVMGAEEGLVVAEKENIPAFFIIKDGDSFIEKKTNALKKILKGDK
jgi:thiamine biosynthesis lipoprotein